MVVNLCGTGLGRGPLDEPARYRGFDAVRRGAYANDLLAVAFHADHPESGVRYVLHNPGFVDTGMADALPQPTKALASARGPAAGLAGRQGDHPDHPEDRPARARRSPAADPGIGSIIGGMTTIETAVADVAGINAFFALGVGGGLPLVERLRDDAIIDETAKRLLTQDRRAAASILFQGRWRGSGLRTWVWMAAHGISVDLADARWSDDGVRVPELREGPRFALEPLAAALPWVSPQVLYGNAASALTGAVGAFVQGPAGERVQGRGAPARVAGRGPALRPLDRRGVRRSCCPYYRVGRHLRRLRPHRHPLTTGRTGQALVPDHRPSDLAWSTWACPAGRIRPSSMSRWARSLLRGDHLEVFFLGW